MALTHKQHRFIDEYVASLNATQAAIRAGYSKATASVQGSRLLRNVKVEAEIASHRAKLSEKMAVTQEFVIEGLLGNHRKSMELKRPNFSASIRALELVGKHIGMWPKGGGQNVEEKPERRPPTDNPALNALVLEMEERSKQRWGITAAKSNRRANGNSATVISEKDEKG